MNLIDINISVNSNTPILFSHVKDIPNSSYHSFHLHDYVEIFVYISGDVSFILKENYVTLKTGNVILIDSNTIHKPIINSPENYERFFIGIPKNAFSFMNNGESPLSFIKKNNQIINLSDSEFHTATAILNNISRNLKKGNEHTYVTYSYLLQFLNIINKSCEKATAISHYSHPDTPSLVTDVLNFIETSPSACNSVKELAEIFHVNASYLSTVFSQSTHVTLKHYINFKKISIAKNLLLGEDSLCEIAYECGFSSCSHFISVFKSTTGKTPKEYRKENKL